MLCTRFHKQFPAGKVRRPGHPRVYRSSTIKAVSLRLSVLDAAGAAVVGPVCMIMGVKNEGGDGG